MEVSDRERRWIAALTKPAKNMAEYERNVADEMRYRPHSARQVELCAIDELWPPEYQDGNEVKDVKEQDN